MTMVTPIVISWGILLGAAGGVPEGGRRASHFSSQYSRLARSRRWPIAAGWARRRRTPPGPWSSPSPTAWSGSRSTSGSRRTDITSCSTTASSRHDRRLRAGARPHAGRASALDAGSKFAQIRRDAVPTLAAAPGARPRPGQPVPRPQGRGSRPARPRGDRRRR